MLRSVVRVVFFGLMLIAPRVLCAGADDEVAAFEADVESFATRIAADEGVVLEEAPEEEALSLPPSSETDIGKANAEIDRLKGVIADLWAKLQRERRNSYYNMGYVYKVCGQYERAETEFLKALEMDPDDPGIHYNLGILYQDDLKNRTKARLHYEKFLDLAPHDPDSAQVRQWLSGL